MCTGSRGLRGRGVWMWSETTSATAPSFASLEEERVPLTAPVPPPDLPPHATVLVPPLTERAVAAA